MALPISTWFCSSRWVVASLSGRSAAALTMYRRVHVMWSSHSLRMASRKARAGVGAAAEAEEEAGEADEIFPAPNMATSITGSNSGSTTLAKLEPRPEPGFEYDAFIVSL